MELFDVYPLHPVTIIKGEGAYVWDDQGNQYLDFYGGHAVISVGHAHPHYVQRLTEQLQQIGFYSNSIQIPQQRELATKLGQLSGKPDYQLFLCNSGAEANENALKLASFHTGRKKIVAFSGAFHGRTSLAVAATDNKGIVAPVNKTDNILFLPFNDVAALDAYFAAHGNEIAGVIVEGIQGVGGINIASDAFLQSIRRHCDQYGAVFIADSVQCGYGRSGRFFSHDHAGIAADIYTMAKGMGNGFPIGAIAIAPHIKPKHGMLGTTFGGNHLACAAAIAVLEIMEQEQLLQQAETMGQYIMEQLRSFDALGNVRGRGLMIGFDMPATHPDMKKNLLNKHRIFTGEAKPNVIRLLPALNITKAAADQLLQAIAIELNNH
jgi:acetylornithine aminotransferase